MKLQRSVCDMPCCAGEDARTYEVRMPDGALKADLCEQHADVLFDLRSRLPKALFSKPGARRKNVRIQVDPQATQ